MPLPSGVTRIGPRSFVFNGNIMYHCDTLAEIAAHRGAAIFFNDGSHVIIGGQDLENAMWGLDNASPIGQLAVRENQSTYFRPQNMIKDNRSKVRGFVSVYRTGAVRTVTHIFAVPLSPFVKGYRSQSATAPALGDTGKSLNVYGTPTVVDVAATADITTFAAKSSNGFWVNSAFNGDVGSMYPAAPGASMIISVPIGVTWETFLQQCASKFDSYDKAEVRAKVDEAIAAVLPTIKKLSPLPVLHLPLRYSGAGWQLLLPVNTPTGVGLGTMTAMVSGAAADNGGAPLTIGHFTGLGAEAKAPIASIDGFAIQQWSRGAQYGANVVAGTLVKVGDNYSMQQLLVLYHGAQASTSTDSIPTRPVVNGVPVTNAAWGTAIETAANTPANQQAINMVGLSTWDANGFSPMHGLILMVAGLNPGKYEMSEFLAMMPTVLWRELPSITNVGFRAAAYSQTGDQTQLIDMPGLPQYLAWRSAQA